MTNTAARSARRVRGTGWAGALCMSGVLALGASLSAGAAERKPMVAADPVEPYASARTYDKPASRAQWREQGPAAVVAPGAEGLLTVDPDTRRYTWWYTRDGERRTMTFSLANRIDLVVRARVERTTIAGENGGERAGFAYRYVIERLPGSAQPLRYFVFQVDPEHVIWDEQWREQGDWRVIESARMRRVALSMKGRPDGERERYTVRFKSPHGPHVVNIAAQGYARGPRGAPGVPADKLALGLSGNSVLGQTLAPATRSLPPPREALRKLFEVAERWRWLDEATLSAMRERLEDAGTGDGELERLLADLRARAQGAPEVVAMIDAIEREHGDG